MRTRHSVQLHRAKYVSLTTFRHDGSPVPTPVWFVTRDEGAILIWTGSSTGKVRRIRNDAHVMVAPCDIRGRVTGGTVPGMARFLDDAQLPALVALLRRKYPLVMRGLASWSKVSQFHSRRQPADMVALEISLPCAEGSA